MDTLALPLPAINPPSSQGSLAPGKDWHNKCLTWRILEDTQGDAHVNSKIAIYKADIQGRHSFQPYGCFHPKIMVLPNHQFNRVFHSKPSILGTPIFGIINITWQITIIPEPECFGDFGEIPLLNHHLG